MAHMIHSLNIASSRQVKLLSLNGERLSQKSTKLSLRAPASARWRGWAPFETRRLDAFRPTSSDRHQTERAFGIDLQSTTPALDLCEAEWAETQDTGQHFRRTRMIYWEGGLGIIFERDQPFKAQSSLTNGFRWRDRCHLIVLYSRWRILGFMALLRFTSNT